MSGFGIALLTVAARVRGDDTVGGVAAAVLLLTGELVALEPGADVRGVARFAVGGLATERETGRVGGETVGRIRGFALLDDTVLDDEVTVLLADEREAGRGTDGAGLAAAEKADLLTDRAAGLVGVALVAGEAAFADFTAVTAFGRVVTEREAGRDTVGAGVALTGRGEAVVKDRLAGLVAV